MDKKEAALLKELSAGLAHDVLSCDYYGDMADRIQFKYQKDGVEKSGGGLCKSALADTIFRSLVKRLSGD